MILASVVLPTFNEAENIVPLVHAILNVTAGTAWQPEILVVDDNSPDGTFQVARDAFKDHPDVRVLLRTTDRGFAASIRSGIECATGEWIVVMDTDFTHDPVEIPRLLHVAQVYDVAVGSRFCAGGQMQDRLHYIASLLYNWYIRLLLRTQIQDNLGGYFAVRRQRLLELPFDDIFIGYGDYFMRLLHHAQHRGFTIVELPASYQARTKGKSKSKFLSMLFTYTRAAISVRVAARRHRGRVSPRGTPDAAHTGDAERRTAARLPDPRTSGTGPC